MESIVFLDRKTIAPEIVVNKPNFEHSWTEYANLASEKVVDKAKNASIIITNKVKLTSDILSELKHLKLIAVAATGYDCVDIDYCQANNIDVCNIREYAINTVPEHTFSLMLALRRNLKQYQRDLENHRWQTENMFCFFNDPIYDLADTNLVIVGQGAIGQKVGDIAQAFGMNVYFAERKSAKTAREGYTLWQECLAIADVISLHCPLNKETYGLINKEDFHEMSRKPLLINCSRGNLIKDIDLKYALDKQLICGAGVDVADNEPPKDNATIMSLLNYPNFILTPHSAWASHQAQQLLANQLISNIESYVRGRPINIVS